MESKGWGKEERRRGIHIVVIVICMWSKRNTMGDRPSNKNRIKIHSEARTSVNHDGSLDLQIISLLLTHHGNLRLSNVYDTGL
jgi:hypothetical protein